MCLPSMASFFAQMVSKCLNPIPSNESHSLFEAWKGENHTNVGELNPLKHLNAITLSGLSIADNSCASAVPTICLSFA